MHLISNSLAKDAVGYQLLDEFVLRAGVFCGIARTTEQLEVIRSRDREGCGGYRLQRWFGFGCSFYAGGEFLA